MSTGALLELSQAAVERRGHLPVEEYLRDKFSDGMRISLGVSITDMASTIVGRTDLWLNLYNFDWALRGELEF